MPLAGQCPRCQQLQLVEELSSGWLQCKTCSYAFTDLVSKLVVSSASELLSQAVQLAKNPTGGVYLIKSGQHFKIGKANNFEQRLRQVNLELPEKATEVHRIYTDDPLGIESYWHKRFKAKRLNGEWFALTQEDVEVFKARDKM